MSSPSSPIAFFRLLAAEALGVFLIVLLGCGAVVVNAAKDGVIGHLGVALAFGLAVTLACLCAAGWGGGDLNPAVTLARVTRGEVGWKRLPALAAAQIAGAVLAAWLLKELFPEWAGKAVTLSALPQGQALAVEAALTFVMVRAARSAPAGAGAFVAGLAVALDALVGGPLTGASMNPARSIGPALAAGDMAALSQLWIYLAGPALGALAAVWSFNASSFSKQG